MSAGDFVVGGKMYTYEVTREDFTAIIYHDNEQDTWEEMLGGQLETLGLRDVDYNGHFGEFIYFTIDDVDDCEELRDKIRRMIDEYAAGK